VHAAEDALLHHPEDAGQKAKGQIGIVLEGSGEEIADTKVLISKEWHESQRKYFIQWYATL
ncbi:MAG TPA: hypothetical protein DEP43_05680, partial [Ruminococcaceae bacterium]|nr:hypothetical protein [Oscillospiraceae bacterium]